MIRKKYFILTAVLLIGVVLLSGCMGGEDLLDRDDEVEEIVDNTGAKVTLQNAMKEIRDENINKAELYFTDDFQAEFYDSGKRYEDSTTFINNWSGFSSSIIEEFSEINTNRYKVNLVVTLSNNEKRYSQFEIEFKKHDGSYLISEIKDLKPESEIDFIKETLSSIENKNKTEFTNSFSDNVKIDDEYLSTVSEPSYLYDEYSSNVIETKFTFAEHYQKAKNEITIFGETTFTYSDDSTITRPVKIIIDNSSSYQIIFLKIEYNNN